MSKLSVKAKIAVAVSVCAVFIVLAIIITCVSVAVYRRSTYGDGIFEVAEYTEIKTVFGADAMYLKDSFIDENYIQPYKFIDFGKTPNKTQKEGKVTGYDEVAVRYHIELKPQIELADNMTLTDVTAEYDKKHQTGGPIRCCIQPEGGCKTAKEGTQIPDIMAQVELGRTPDFAPRRRLRLSVVVFF